MTQDIGRREFVGQVAGLAIGLGLGAGCATARTASAKPWFEISLAEWSFHKALFAGTMDHLDFARTAKTQFGIDLRTMVEDSERAAVLRPPAYRGTVRLPRTFRLSASGTSLKSSADE